MPCCRSPLSARTDALRPPGGCVRAARGQAGPALSPAGGPCPRREGAPGLRPGQDGPRVAEAPPTLTIGVSAPPPPPPLGGGRCGSGARPRQQGRTLDFGQMSQQPSDPLPRKELGPPHQNRMGHLSEPHWPGLLGPRPTRLHLSPTIRSDPAPPQAAGGDRLPLKSPKNPPSFPVSQAEAPMALSRPLWAARAVGTYLGAGLPGDAPGASLTPRALDGGKRKVSSHPSGPRRPPSPRPGRPRSVPRFWAGPDPGGGYRWASLPPRSRLPRRALEPEKEGPVSPCLSPPARWPLLVCGQTP